MPSPTPTSAVLHSIPPSLHCNFTVPSGAIALGSSRSERDILQLCCHTLDTKLGGENGTACAQWAECKVEECSMRDPAFACVVEMRKVWEVAGGVGCQPGVRKSGAGGMRGLVLVSVVMGVVLSVVVGGL